MDRFAEWTDSDIEQMKTAFLQGKTIKDMAKQLGRTPTALNKALSRFGVRRDRKPTKVTAQPCVDWRRYLIPGGQSPNSLDDEAILLPASLKDSFLSHRLFLKATEPNWVSLKKVITYLERQGHRIQILDADSGDYKIDNKAAKAGALLLLANRLRIEENKPIFLVKEVTC
ncbi:hypothetical protein [Candidatus Finniella inopinata]|uniref:Uncharacterized protein n=1 Tax=Candidatus Finniella inopinata TaxID=1696036 RepID=A0A4Q7DHR9_9PROT|nr:hypothetical protein [Candidatus Finniella inopinata]RZI45699.1 hypothetical protein EQU50_06245 [Candidatus Finniella inopinata]